MKEYQYSPLHEPYELQSIIKECVGKNPGCLKTFPTRDKREKFCLKCRSTEREETKKVVPPEIEVVKEPRFGYGVIEIITECKYCGEGVTRRLSNRSAVCYKCRIDRNKKAANKRYKKQHKDEEN